MNKVLLEFDPENNIGLANQRIFANAAAQERRLREIDTTPKVKKIFLF